MEWYIKKNATLPVLKIQVVKDGRSDYNNFMDMIEQSAIFFSMVNTETGIPKITTRPAGFVEKIQIDRLDDYGFQNVRLIKIDVEGLELAVIKGGLETLKSNDYPPIIFETWSIMDWYQERRKEILSYVESLGYDITSIGDNCIAQHTSRKVIQWANKEK
jgi:FkbM family methyltransferase